MGAVAAIFFRVVVAAEAKAIGDALKDMHSGAAAWTENLRLSFFALGLAGDKLVTAKKIFTTIFLLPRIWVFAKFPNRTFTFRTTYITKEHRHNKPPFVREKVGEQLFPFRLSECSQTKGVITN